MKKIFFSAFKVEITQHIAWAILETLHRSEMTLTFVAHIKRRYFDSSNLAITHNLSIFEAENCDLQRRKRKKFNVNTNSIKCILITSIWNKD